MPASNKYSQAKIFGFPDKIRSFQSGAITPPLYVRIKPINRCNHACSWCAYSDGYTRPKDRPDHHLQSGMHDSMLESSVMPAEAGKELLHDLGDMGVKAVTFSGGGEPMLHPALSDFLDICMVRGIRYSIITNGQLLTALAPATVRLGFAAWVRVSMDYATPEQMVASRNVHPRAFDQVLANLRAFTLTKKPDCDLGVNFIVTRENFNDIFTAAKLLKEVGVGNVRFSPVYCEGFEEYHRSIADRVRDHLAVIQETLADKTFEVNSSYDISSPSKARHHDFKRCFYAQTVPVVGADLGVYACHNTAYSDHGLLGSIKGRRFRDWWGSPEMAEAWRKLVPAQVCNHECANHEKVALFENLAAAGERPDSFV